MNCASARNRLLALPDPAALPEPLQAHMDGCPACQAWHRLALQVETAVAAIPVPATDGNAKRQLLAKVHPPAPRPAKPKKIAPNAPIIKTPLPLKALVRPASDRQSLGERLARLWPAGLVAAAILVGAISWAVFGGKSKDIPVAANIGPDPMLKDVVVAKVKLDTAHTPAARVDVLASLADSIHEEARTLSKVTPGDEMTSLAKMYEQVVRDGLVPQARALSEDERRTKLPAYAEKLAKAEQEANRLAAEAPVGSDGPLRDIADTARTAKFELTRLIQGGVS